MRETDTLYYDGHCGLCHRSVRFVLKHERSGNGFRFAPLQGETFRTRISSEVRATLPDSIIVQTHDGVLLARSDALVLILRRFGGWWRISGDLLAVIPRPVRDAMYDLVAHIRYRIFGRTADVCPVMSPEQRARFDP